MPRSFVSPTRSAEGRAVGLAFVSVLARAYVSSVLDALAAIRGRAAVDRH